MKFALRMSSLALITWMAMQVHGMELLTNGNLEQAGGPPPGWSLLEYPSSGSGTYDVASQATFADLNGGAGNYGLWLKPWAGGGAPPGQLVNAVLSQTVPASAGLGYSFAGWSRWEDNYSGGVATLDPDSPFGAIPSPTRTEMSLEFLNSGGGVIGSHLLDLRTVQNNFDFWAQHEFNQIFGGGNPLVAPAGTTQIRVTAAMYDGAFNTNPRQSAFFDEFTLYASNDPGNNKLINGGLNMQPPDFPGWDVTENPDGVDTVNPQSAPWAQNTNTAGSIGAFLHPWANGGLVSNPNDAIMEQTVAGVAGGNYTYKMWTKFEGNYAGGVSTLDGGSPNGAVTSPTSTVMKLEFLDSGQNLISMSSLDLRADRAAQGGGNANDSVWRQHTINAVAPANTAFVRVNGSMLAGVFNVDPQQSAFFDDFSLTVQLAVSGDFNNDGFWNCADINALTTAIANGSTNLMFDMNGDGQINLLDVTAAGSGWLAVGGAQNPAQTNGNPFRNGDANLDGVVDGSDFGVWNASKFTSTTNWCSGNFNGDGVADGSDFGIWNANKFTSSSDFGVVPEPMSACAWFMLSICGLALRRRSSK